MDAWIVSVFCSRSSSHRVITTRRFSRLDAGIIAAIRKLNFYCYFSDTMLLSIHVERISVSRVQDFKIKVIGINKLAPTEVETYKCREN